MPRQKTEVTLAVLHERLTFFHGELKSQITDLQGDIKEIKSDVKENSLKTHHHSNFISKQKVINAILSVIGTATVIAIVALIFQ